MADYLYKATTISGQVVEGSMDGRDEGAVVRSLQQMGYIPVKVVPAGNEAGGQLRFPSIESRLCAFRPWKAAAKWCCLYRWLRSC
jgi:type II secretory pathway component PulF